MYINNDHQNRNDDNLNQQFSGYIQPLPPTPPEDTPVKKKHKHISSGIIALSLSMALIGGIAGGGATGYYLSRQNNNNTAASVTSTTNDGTVRYATSVASGTANSINTIYEKNKSAVVGIKSEGTTTNIFGQETPMASSGTGFIISSDGYILTNNHVIENSSKLTVTLNNEDSYTATVVGADADGDVALVKINATGLNAVTLGNSDNLVVGETVVAIGNPLGELTYTVTAGIVSAENREIDENGVPINMFQTDAAINPGNSGGPVFNLSGEVVGISTAKYASDKVEGIGFAIPINDAVSVANQIKQTGHVKSRPYLGVSVTDAVSPQAGSTDTTEGAYVAVVDPSGGAAKAGIQQGDIITAINGKSIKSSSQLIIALRSLDAGSSVTVTILRDGKSMNLTVTLDESKSNA